MTFFLCQKRDQEFKKPCPLSEDWINLAIFDLVRSCPMRSTLKGTNFSARTFFFFKKKIKKNTKMIINTKLHINMNYKTLCFLQSKRKVDKV